MKRLFYIIIIINKLLLVFLLLLIFALNAPFKIAECFIENESQDKLTENSQNSPTGIAVLLYLRLLHCSNNAIPASFFSENT